MRVIVRKYSTAADRWAGVGPYYAMFPRWFSNAVITKYTSPGDAVLDPFAGRGTAVFSAATQDRIGIGIEINPVGWVYSRTKLNPAAKEDVEARVRAIGAQAWRYHRAAKELPKFFKSCYSLEVRAFLLAARSQLAWRYSRTDRTMMALLLVHLHGKSSDSLSNQLRQAKSMSPEYAIRWWRERSYKPPDWDPVAFLTKKLVWRYAKGLPEVRRSHIYLGDSLRVLPRIVSSAAAHRIVKPKLLLTSPPYRNVANYHYDQWLRLWLLGGAPDASRDGHRFKGKFENLQTYRNLLTSVFQSCAVLLDRGATVYVRTSERSDTYEATVKSLKSAFPHRPINQRYRPYRHPTQTHLFGDLTPKMGEVDLVLLPS